MITSISKVIAKLREDLDRLQKNLDFGYDVKTNNKTVPNAFATLTGTMIQLNSKMNSLLKNEDQTYNGWPNYETWCVALWAGNDEPLYRTIQRLVKAHVTNKSTAYVLAAALRDFFETPYQQGGYANMYVDLLNAAMREVDWNYFAEHLMNDEIENREYEAAEAAKRIVKIEGGDNE